MCGIRFYHQRSPIEYQSETRYMYNTVMLYCHLYDFFSTDNIIIYNQTENTLCQCDIKHIMSL
jgi:hypothetical protein